MLSMDLEKAKDSLCKAVEFMPNHIGTWHLLAWCQLMTSQLKEALESFESALKLNRNFGDSHGGVAIALVVLDRIEEAKESMRRAIKLDPESMAGLYAKSLIAEIDGNTAESKMIMDKLMNSSSAKKGANYLPYIQKFMKRG
jgi:Tfp pilus assembly protein PilF